MDCPVSFIRGIEGCNMSEEIKDTLWGAAAAAGVIVLLKIFGLPDVLLAVLFVPVAIAGSVTSSYLRDKRISVEYERKLNARYEEAELYIINAKPKVDTSEDSEEAELHATLGGSAAPARAAGSSFYVTERFTNYMGDKGSVVSSDESAIAAFIAANPGITRVTCQGSTSGVPANSSDSALALSRAENACDIVEKLVPGVTVKYATSTGKGVGQFYRAVKIYAAGTAE
jgi:hypothetical protein